MPRYIDLSHPIRAGMVTYPGLPAPVVGDHLSREASHDRYAPGYEFHIGRVEMVGNTGTYLDTPFHRYPDGHDMAGLELGRVVDLPGVVVDGPASGPVVADLFGGLDLRGRAVLIRTGWSRHFGTERYGDPSHPALDAGAADALVSGGAALIGIDSVNIDLTTTGERPVHTALLGAGIAIVEHLVDLDRLPAVFTFTAVPAPVVGIGSFPVRAFATVPDEPATGDESAAGAS